MTQIPAMMLWTDAYMADTSHLTTIENGAYLLILMAMWRAGGSLPDDDVRLARTSRLTLDKWRKMAPTIREFLSSDGGFVTQKRLKQELEIARSKAEKYASAGRAGGNAKSLNNKKQIPSEATETLDPKLKQPPSLSEPEPELDSSLRSEKEERVSASHSCRKQVSAMVAGAKQFYDAYPKHIDPRAAEKKFLTLVRSGVDPDHIIAAAERYAEAHRVAGTDKQMIPAPAVWLNRGGYDSEDLPRPRVRPHRDKSMVELCLDEISEIDERSGSGNGLRLIGAG